MPKGITLKTDLLAESRGVMEFLKEQTNKPRLTGSDVRQLSNMLVALNKAAWELEEWRAFFLRRRDIRDQDSIAKTAKKQVINEKEITEVRLDESKDYNRFAPCYRDGQTAGHGLG